MNQSKWFSVLRINAVVTAIAILALTTFGAISDAQAKITAFFSAGATCEGAPAANFVAAGPAVKISLCVTATTESLCGHTTKLQAADARGSGRFHVTSLALGPNYSDPNSQLTFPIAITNPPALPDFGATVSSAAVVTAAKQLLAIFDVSPQAGAKEAVYVISLAPISSVGVSTDSTCAMPTDSSIAASFTLTQRSAKASKK